MKTALGIIGGIIAFLLFISVLAFGSGWMRLAYTKTFGVAQADAERGVFEQTRSYHQAKQQELAKLKLEYERSDSDSTLAATIRHRFADYEIPASMPNELAEFLRRVRGY